MSTARDDLKARIDAIEEAYEFFLAYAAQGLTTDEGAKSGGHLRGLIKSMETALDGLAECFRRVVTEDALEPAGAWSDLLDVLARDAGSTLAAIRVVSARPGVSSQLIDNLNANIHLRALLTDLFLMDDLIE